MTTAATPHLYEAEFGFVSQPDGSIKAAHVRVTQGFSMPAAGVYLVIDERGPLARLEVTRATQGDSGLVGMELTPKTPWLRGPPERDTAISTHYVVVGPFGEGRPCARLMFLGLARAGHAASRPADPPGRALPGNRGPRYAVDLDRDGKADLIRYIFSRGSSMKGPISIRRFAGETWRHDGRRWSRIEQRQWEQSDLIGP